MTSPSNLAERPAVVATTDGRDRVAAPVAALTGLRWIAAALVFLTHAANVGLLGGDLPTWLAGLLGAGSTGVSLFFVLSGFVLAISARPSDRPGTFWWRRLARVYPLHLLTAASAIVLVTIGVPGPGSTSAPASAANLLLLSAWHHPWWQALNPVSWSLVCEAFFYACFPLLFRTLNRSSTRLLRWSLVASVGAVWALAAAAEYTAVVPFSLYDFPLGRLPEFVAGVAAGCLVRRDRWQGPSVRVSAMVAVLGFAAVPVLPFPFQIAAATVLGFVLLVPALAVAGDPPAVLASPAAVRWGAWSFAFYLVHLQVLWVASWMAGPDRDGAAPLIAIAAFTAAALLSRLLHTFVEVPAHRRLTGRLR